MQKIDAYLETLSPGVATFLKVLIVAGMWLPVIALIIFVNQSVGYVFMVFVLRIKWDSFDLDMLFASFFGAIGILFLVITGYVVIAPIYWLYYAIREEYLKRLEKRATYTKIET